MKSKTANSIQRPAWARYGFGLFSVAAAAFVRWLLDPLLKDNIAFLTLYGGVAAAVWFGGWRPAVVAALSGFLLVDYLFIPPRHTFANIDPLVSAAFAGYSISCGLIIYLGEAMRRARQRAEQHGEQLEKEIIERARAEAALKEAHELLAYRAQHLESIVEQRTARLQETIGDLETFSYSIVHDMRAPLRAMYSFAQLLAAECSHVSPAAADYVQRIMTAAQRMDRLILDMLNYSRVVRAELQLTAVDVGVLLRGLIATCPMFQPPLAHVELEGDFPIVRANEAALTQCISNLLDNAMKFFTPGATPRVRVWAETRGAEVRLFFQDNGIGIEKSAHEKIFQMFQRLSKQYDGTGVGLTIVKKSIERMNGSVGIESEPGHGSTFWLQLARAVAGAEQIIPSGARAQVEATHLR